MTAVAVQSFGFGDQLIRAIDREGEAWFVGNDVCAALELANPRDAMSRLDEDERDCVGIADAIGRDRETTVISESGVYSLTFTSRKEAAKRFKRWVTHEVLPALRRTGRYEMPANDRAGPRILDLEGALGTADDRHAIKTALLTVNTYKDLYGAQAGRDMMQKLGFPIPGIDLPLSPVVTVDGGVQMEGDLHHWGSAVGLRGSRRDATSVTELYARYVQWCGETHARPMTPARFKPMMVMLFDHEEHPEMIRAVITRR